MHKFLYKIVVRILSFTRFAQNGTVEVSGWVKGLKNVEFEGANAVSNFSNFNGKIKVGYATTFGIHNLIHGEIEIGKYCQFGPYSAINTFNHPFNHMTTYINKRLLKGEMSKYKTCTKTIIGNDVWVGKNAVILGGVTIGDGAIIAAGSIVTKDVAPYSVVGGVPAKELKKRFNENIIRELEELKWWNKSEDEIVKISNLFHKDLSKLNSIYE